MSENKKKKESDLESDSQSLPDDILEALAHASEEDEADFLDALSLDVDDELESDASDVSDFDSFSGGNDSQSNSQSLSSFPELNLNEVPDEEQKDPFGLAEEVSDISNEVTVAHTAENLDSLNLEPPSLDDVDVGDESEPEESLVSFGEEEMSKTKDFEDLDEVSDLSAVSEDLESVVAGAEDSVDINDNEALSSEAVMKSSKDSDATEFATMAIGSIESDEVSPEAKSSGRNPLIDLKNADYIKFAQDKIKGLEKQLFDLRGECEELARAGDHFKNIADERGQKIKTLEAKVDELGSLAGEEKKILQESLSSKNLRINTMQEHIENLEQELESRYNRVRERERDLEGRLEILKKEQSAVAKSKDEMILKLKSQNESIKSDLEKIRAQSQKVTSHLQEKEDALRRTMKALKLSLTMLESQNKD